MSLMSQHSAVPANTAEATRDLQNRLGRFARTTGVIAGVMLIASVTGSHLADADAAPSSIPSSIVHVFAIALAFAIWRLMRGKALKVPVIHVLDAALVITLCTCWALLGLGIAPTDPVEFSVILAITYTLSARAVIVPSTFRRTLALGAVSIVPTLVFFYTRKMRFVAHATASQVQFFLMFATLWCLVAVVSSSLQSRLLYGLRERIREATKLGQYTLQEKIGEGGMGAVYRATHAMLRRPAAIKLLLPGRAGEPELARFEREVQLTTRLQHPNTISIFDYGRTSDGTFYYVMELLDGIDLQALVRLGGPLPAARVRHVLVHIAEALAEAHAIGLIHRDVKPANIMLCPPSSRHELAKLLDFGLVHDLGNLASGTPEAVHEGPNGDDDPERTRTGLRFAMGTPLYMAPEAISSPESIGPRADLYALAAVGYFLLTGQPVFDAPTLGEICDQQLHAPPLAPSARLGVALHEGLERAILRSLAKAPEHRAASATAFADELSKLELEPWTDEDARIWWSIHGQCKTDSNAFAATVVDVVRPKVVPLSMKVDLRNR
jgi:eukaryotic-like serine/threonine-protein kinase